MMLPESTQQIVIEEIKLFIEYGVSEAEQTIAKGFVDKYRNTPLVLTALLHFYKVLPEAREEAVVRIAQLEAVQGVILLAISTSNHNYIAAVSEGEAHLLGEYEKEKLPKEILSFFGYGDTESFQKRIGPLNDLPELDTGSVDQDCPVCHVGTGEYHLLGCPVEICPWCDGQLNKCNCRFEKLEVETLDTDEQIELFTDLLETQGRIPYDAKQKPSYPGTSRGLDKNSM